MHSCIVVIDDSLVIRKILDVALRRAGYEVQCFPDGVEALRWLARPEADIPALVLVDLGLPKLDGYEVIRLLKARPSLQDTSLVILSARDGVLDRLKGRLLGVQTYLTKPFKTEQVLSVIRAYVDVPTPESRWLWQA